MILRRGIGTRCSILLVRALSGIVPSLATTIAGNTSIAVPLIVVVVVVVSSRPLIATLAVRIVGARCRSRCSLRLRLRCRPRRWVVMGLLLAARTSLVHHPTLAVLSGLVELAFHHNGSIGK